MDDAQRIIWLEQQVMKSQSGISFGYVPSVEGEPSGYRFMRRGYVGAPHKTIREAIDAAMRETP